MTDAVRLVIKDSCILFDLIDLGLMDAFFSLELEVHTTQFVIGEVTDDFQLKLVDLFVQSGQLKIDSSGSIDLINRIYDQCAGLSLADCSILEMVMRKDGMVLSSDGALRKEILKRKFNVRGLLWVINELRDNGCISKEEAIQKLLKYKAINTRAPITEIDKLIRQLNSQ